MDHIKIKNRQRLGFLVVEPENLKFQHVPQKKKNKKDNKGLYLENEKGKQEAFWTTMTLHMQVEM